MKPPKLSAMEELVAIRPDIRGPSGDNPIILVIRTAKGGYRFDVLDPCDFTRDIRLLFNAYAASYEAMRDAVMKRIT